MFKSGENWVREDTCWEERNEKPLNEAKKKTEGPKREKNTREKSPWLGTGVSCPERRRNSDFEKKNACQQGSVDEEGRWGWNDSCLGPGETEERTECVPRMVGIWDQGKKLGSQSSVLTWFQRKQGWQGSRLCCPKGRETLKERAFQCLLDQMQPGVPSAHVTIP